MCGGAAPSFAYRPFDGTDAAVAEPGQLEVELQPAGRLQEGSQSFLVAPGIVLNFGLTRVLEAVFEGRLLIPLSSSEPPNLTDAGTFLKYVVRPGVLQDKSGPSIATEFGVLYPETAGDSHFGASWAGIISQRWDSGTAHGFRGFDGTMRIKPGRKAQSKEGASAYEVIVYMNGRVVGVSNLFDDRQTQAGTAV